MTRMAITESVAGASSPARNGRSSRSPLSSELISLPATVDWLRDQGLLLETDVEVNPDLELTGIQKGLDGSYPIVFNTVRGYPHGVEDDGRSEEHTSELQSHSDLVCRLLLEKKKDKPRPSEGVARSDP